MTTEPGSSVGGTEHERAPLSASQDDVSYAVHSDRVRTWALVPVLALVLGLIVAGVAMLLTAHP